LWLKNVPKMEQAAMLPMKALSTIHFITA